ncbi:saccharopine dehydrogenase family protein [Pelomyxa schiedti]|nr:saccharopine dehydrogenase family protein [Pelomyxa schiedti]
MAATRESAVLRRVDNIGAHITGTKNVLVLGGGLVGGVMAGDLSRDPLISVTVADGRPDTLSALQKLYPRIRKLPMDLSNRAAIVAAAKPFDMVVGALPSGLGFNALNAVVEAGKNYVDISFMEQDYTQLDSKAKAKGITVICDCGVAPGMSHMMSAYGSMFFLPDACEECVMYIGGIPQNPKPPFNYKAPWCPHDVFSEYTRESTIIQNGKAVQVPALSELETIRLPMVPGNREMEAFITDGLRSIAKNPIAKNMKEKTLRWPGHQNFVLSLREAGFLSSKPITITSTGQTIIPDDFTSHLLLPHWKQNLVTEPECTIMRVQLIGTGNDKSGFPGRRCKVTFDLYQTTDYALPFPRSSMSVTTGCTCAVVARMVLMGQYAVPGVHPPECIGFHENLFLHYTEQMRARNVKWQFNIEAL